MAASCVLIVDTPAGGLWSLAARLRADGLDVVEAVSTEAALGAVGRGIGLLLVHHAAAIDLAALLDQARGRDADLAVLVVIPGQDDVFVPGAIAGAERIRLSGDLNALATRAGREATAAYQRRQLRAWQRAAGEPLGVEAILGDSEPVARIRTVIRKLAASVGVPTIVSGEPGSGRAFVARVVHDTSERRGQPFVRLDCTRRPQLAAAWLGSAGETGAVEWAHGGTLFLEHVDRLTPDLQVALLRLVEEGLFRRIGGTLDEAANIRIVASTAADLEAEVEAGRFRRDLYLRLNVVRLDLPPLRRRGRDILLLAAHFAAVEGVAHRLSAVRFDDAAAEPLLRYAWPGNVRELRQVIARAVLLSTTDVLTADDFSVLDPSRRNGAGSFVLPAEGVNLGDLERRLVMEALERTGGNQTHAADLLGMHRDQIRYRMQKYGLRR